MSAHSVKLRFKRQIEDAAKKSPTNKKGTCIVEGCVYISPRTARELSKSRKANICSHHPFEIALKTEAQDELERYIVQRWTPVSEGLLMNGAILGKPIIRQGGSRVAKL